MKTKERTPVVIDDNLTYHMWMVIINDETQSAMWREMYHKPAVDEETMAGFLCQALRDFWKPLIVNKETPASKEITGRIYASIDWHRLALTLVRGWRKRK